MLLKVPVYFVEKKLLMLSSRSKQLTGQKHEHCGKDVKRLEDSEKWQTANISKV